MAAIPDMPSTPADESDVTIELDFSDVFTTALADYTGELRATSRCSCTDRVKHPVPRCGHGTRTSPDRLQRPLHRQPGPGGGLGLHAVDHRRRADPRRDPAAEAKRAMWQLDQVRVFDGGAHDDGDTTGDNTLFATPGLVPSETGVAGLS